MSMEPLSELQPAMVPAEIVRVDALGGHPAADTLAVEEPLEIRLCYGPARARQRQTISLTMRTPGHDRELAAGFLFTEGIIEGTDQVAELRAWEPELGPGSRRNVVRVELREDVAVDVGRLQRHFYTTSSCGVCGKTSLEALETAADRSAVTASLEVVSEVLLRAPETLRAAQGVFGRTGGLHAAALFDPDGSLLALREDVGRHNALDKLLGAQLLAGALPASGVFLLLSGRASFELLQKAFMAGLPLVAAVGAPSSLAVELAQRFGMTLVGWLRGERFSIYSHPERIRIAPGGER
jgi:FdhD protein